MSLRIFRLVLLVGLWWGTSAHAEEEGSFFSRFFRLEGDKPADELLVPASPAGTMPTEELRVQELGSVTPPTTVDLTAQPDDLWVRVRNGFAMPDLNDDLVLHYQQWYQARPEALRRMVERSRPYLHHIVEEIEARGMPTELALLPMVESSFNPMAYSRAHASGLWQFIPATGKRFNLAQNWWQDQRRDIVASTGAALEYLQAIYDLHGDWQLALASYNWGEGAVKRAIEKNQARGLPTDFSSLTMPPETRHYVPKLQALKNIFGNSLLMQRLGLPEVPNRPYFSVVSPGRLVDMKTAARLANMSLPEFQALNPAHNRPVMPEDSRMVIPNDRLQAFQENLDNATGPLSAWQSYTLKSGEKLHKVAPRFGIPLADLLRINGLSAKSTVLPGTTLLVPNPDAPSSGEADIGQTATVAHWPQIAAAEPRAATRMRTATVKTKSLPPSKTKPAAKTLPVKASTVKTPMVRSARQLPATQSKAGKGKTAKKP